MYIIEYKILSLQNSKKIIAQNWKLNTRVKISVIITTDLHLKNKLFELHSLYFISMNFNLRFMLKKALLTSSQCREYRLNSNELH